jgi:hypothetical protein
MPIFSTYIGVLGYVIGGDELKIDPMKIEAILRWPNLLISLIFGYLWGNHNTFRILIASFSSMVAPLHVITTSNKSFQWGRNQQKYFEYMK